MRKGKDLPDRKKANRIRRKKERENAGVKMSKAFRNITIIFLIVLALIAIRLIGIHVFDGNKYTKAALNQSASANETIAPKRGDIIDRNGIRLATSARVYNLILDPKVIMSKPEKYKEPTLALVERCFGIPVTELEEKIEKNPNSSYVVLKKELTYKDVEEYLLASEEDANIKGVWLEDNFKRTYPCGTLASSVIGFTQEGTGSYGVEYSYNDELQGNEGRQYTYVNSENVLETVRKDAQDGNTVEMTIDYNIQSIVEKYIKQTYEETKAKNVAVLIQNPNTGEILAMADAKSFDPNKPRDLSSSYTKEEIDQMTDKETTDALSEIWKNFCITQSFEPGSTFKPFTLAGALSINTTTMEDEFFCGGSLTFYDMDVIHCHVTDGHGALDTKDVMAQSCNVGFMTIAERMGKEEFCKMQTRFGFGHSTGIDLPNEMSCNGLLYTVDRMNQVDLATNSFGQNFNVTMIQMSSAFSSLLNGGNYYKPYIVKNIYNPDGALIKSNDKTLVSTTVSTGVAKDVKDAMREVVTEGTGTSAAVTGYKIAGKTGTAEKYDAEVEVTEDDKYLKKEGLYLTSFIGFAPFENPEIVCYAVVDEADKGEDSTYAGRLFSQIMTEVLPYLNIAPDGDENDVSMWEYYVPVTESEEEEIYYGEDGTWGEYYEEGYVEDVYSEEVYEVPAEEAYYEEW